MDYLETILDTNQKKLDTIPSFPDWVLRVIAV
jgi:hypothetical protein